MIDKSKIPPSWDVVKLGEVCENVEVVKRKEKNGDTEFLYLDIGGIDNSINKIVSHKKYKWKDAPSRAQRIIFKDDVLFSTVRTYLKNIAIVENKTYNGEIASSGFTVIRGDKKVTNPKFLFYLSLSHSFLQPLNELQTGSSYPAVRDKDVFSQAIPLPPLHEQHRIVSKIEELFSELDKGIESLKTAQQQLKIYRQAVLKWAFEGRLTEEWRKENSHLNTAYDYLRQVSEIRKKNFLEAKKNGIKAIEKNYDFEFRRSEEINTWAKATLSKLIYIAGRIGWRGLTKDEYTTEGPLFLSVHSLNYGKHVEFEDAYHISEERYLESPEIMLKDKDILLCKDGAGIGKIGIINKLPSEATVNSSLLIIRGMEIFIPEFLYHLLSGPKLQSIVRKRITGSATPHLFQNDIRKFELLIPPLEEQNQIVQEIETRLSVCDKLEETITTALQQSEALRQSILKKAFEGKLVEQNPKDEPASKLLERIKAEKAAELRHVYRKK
ncbi:MAG: restriction endonuclease [Candidatus Brocadia sp.]|nr:restriction endonuclease [Candidatus Brocadia sp.]